MVTCPKCGKEFRNKAGLGGHLAGAHLAPPKLDLVSELQALRQELRQGLQALLKARPSVALADPGQGFAEPYNKLDRHRWQCSCGFSTNEAAMAKVHGERPPATAHLHRVRDTGPGR